VTSGKRRKFDEGKVAMSLHDKIRCAECHHPQHRHTGTHVKGSKTACVKRVSPTETCGCAQFRDPLAETLGNVRDAALALGQSAQRAKNKVGDLRERLIKEDGKDGRSR
jgi:hypothetical protein